MTFRDAAAADRDAVFLDLLEFGEEAVVDGAAVNAVIDDAERGDRDLEMGLPSIGMRLFAKTEDMPAKRSPGEAMVVNGVPCMVVSWRDDMGVSEIELARAR